VAVAAVLVGVWYVEGTQVTRQRQVEAQAQSQEAILQTQVSRYAYVTQMSNQLAQSEGTVRSLLAPDVAWPALLTNIADRQPADVWLTSFQGTGPGGGGSGATGSAGTVTIAAGGLDQTAAAHWLQQESKVPALTNLWVASSTKGAGKAPATFSATGNLTPTAQGQRLDHFVHGTPASTSGGAG
ncbi:MAG: hypothetical protein ACRDZQ_03140, partial [Acidimicrobiales bacterium]